MKLVLIAATAVIAVAMPALAQEHPGHYGGDAAPAVQAMDMSQMTPEDMHKHCAMVMGAKMQGTPKHDHAADKMGHAPAMKAPTEADMKAMHDKCAAAMAQPKVAPKP